MKKVAVTGSSGFIGKHLVDKLRQEGIEIKSFSRGKHSLFEKNSLLRLVEGCDTVFHLAAENNPSSPDVFKVNVLGTANLLAAISLLKRECNLIFPSSFAVYRIPKKGQVISENFELAPRNEYGLSKLLCEEIITHYPGNKFISTILRVSNVYGPGDGVGRSVISNFFNQINHNGNLIINGDGNQTRDFIYVDDVVNAMILAASRSGKEKVRIINVCSGSGTSLNELVSLLGKMTEKNFSVIYNKKVNLSAEGFWEGNNFLIKRLLGWKPEIILKNGLLLTWKLIR